MLDAPMGGNRGEIVFTRYDGRRGISWLVDSFRMFRAAPAAWLVRIGAFLALFVLVQFVPFVGGLAALIGKPVLQVGFLAAAWNQERGTTPSIRHLFDGFRSNLWSLLPLGAVMFAGVLLAVLATSLVDGGALFALLRDAGTSTADPDEQARRAAETFADPRVTAGLVVGTLCALPVLLALWWAPALIVFQDAKLLVALRTSLRACLANWRPLFRYALFNLFLGGVAPVVVSAALGLVLPATAHEIVASALIGGFLWCWIAVLQISDYVSYRDVFHAGEPSSDGAERGAAGA